MNTFVTSHFYPDGETRVGVSPMTLRPADGTHNLNGTPVMLLFFLYNNTCVRPVAHLFQYI